jgi:peroxiredoxin Q/BCP
VEIVGISFDPPKANLAFAEKYGFPFTLISDVDGTAGEAYDVKRAPGEKYADSARRVTYLIDPEGRIAKVYEVTNIPSHPDQVLEDFRRLTASASP